MGIAYERSVGFHKDFHVHDRPMIILPRGACVMKVRTTEDQTTTHTIGSSVAFIVPSGVAHEDHAVSSIFDTLVLFPSASLLAAVTDEEGFPKRAAAKVMSRPQTVRRGAWLDRLVQEYVFVRVVSRRESARTRAFFERQLLVEILAAALGRTGSPPARPPEEGTVTARALRHIEANLFSKVSLPALARQALASPSTLLRHFHSDMGTSPHAYIKARRLEEARRLIEEGAQAIGDVAMLVGYENFAAFTTAFTKHFGAPPSAFRGRRRR
jgi:AraC-like DNA-binding protein